MSGPEAIAIFSLTPQCPSEGILDAFELAEPIETSVRSHIESCGVCAARLEERKTAFAALDKASIVRAIHARTANNTAAAGVAERAATARLRPLRGRLIAALSFVAAAAVAAILFLRPPEPPPEETSLKGSIGLDVFVERNGVVHRAIGGGEFHPGDRLRFEVDLPKAAHVLIVGIEADGSMYNGYPTTTSVASALALPGGADQVLPGAVELDEKLGREILHLVACEKTFRSDDIKKRETTLILPEGCMETPFVLKKVD